MKLHSTNYYETLITVAKDSRAETGLVPSEKTGRKLSPIGSLRLFPRIHFFTHPMTLFS